MSTYQRMAQDFSRRFTELKEKGMYKNERILETPQGSRVRVSGGKGGTTGTEVLNFCANNYLGLADNPEVIEAAIEGMR